MPTMKKYLIIISLTIISTTILWSEEERIRTIDDVTISLNQEEKDILEKEKIVFRYGNFRPGLFYLPDVPLAENIERRFNEINPDVTVEAYFKIPYPEDMLAGADRDLILYNIVREVSKISGVQYFSRRKQDYKTLFDDVYVVDEEKKPREDPLVDVIPEYDSFPLHMKEANLGRDYYLAEYLYDGVDMSFSLTNTSNMSFIIKVVGKDNMQIDLLLMPLENEMILYGYCGVKLANPGFVNRIMSPYSSFFRRLYAMEIWFYNTLHGTDILPDKDLVSKGRK